MATISSTIRLQDRFSAIIDNTIHAMTRMVDTMEDLNQSANLPDLDGRFGEIRADISLANHALEEFNDELLQADQHTDTINQLSFDFGDLSRAVIVANQGLQLVQQTWGDIQRLGELADKRTGADARLNLINDGLRTQEQLEAQVLGVANETRTEYAITGELVAKMGRQDYFKGNNDAALAFAKTLNEGLIVSGASSMEAESALTQLTQGLASGVLRGEEFNSIMENGSVLAEMMADSLGVNKGQLRAMAEDGALTTEVVVSAIMGQATAIEEQFNRMPVTFGQSCTAFENHISNLMNTMSQPDQAMDILISKIEEMNAWLDSTEGSQFMDSVASGAAAAASGICWLMDAAANTYQFFNDNWPTIAPILLSIATAVGIVTAAYLAHKAVHLASMAIEAAHAIKTGILGAATLAHAIITGTATAAQWGLNAAFLACPLTWVIIVVLAVIAAIVALTVWIMKLWQTNVDFKVGVITVWNSILNWFDQVPIFFTGIGYGVLDAFSNMKVGMMVILEAMVNGAIERINRLIELANKIPGVAIETMSGVTFGAETVLEERAAQAERAAELAAKQVEAAAKASARANELAKDEIGWRAEAAAKKQAKQADKAANSQAGAGAGNFPPVTLEGGSIDKVGSIGKEIDISNQSLEYLRDIAEIEVLGGISSTIDYVERDSLRLSQEDADLMRRSANSDTNIYYLQYQGGVRIKNDMHKGEDWESIKQDLYNQSQHEIETGISGMEEVLYG